MLLAIVAESAIQWNGMMSVYFENEREILKLNVSDFSQSSISSIEYGSEYGSEAEVRLYDLDW